MNENNKSQRNKYGTKHLYLDILYLIILQKHFLIHPISYQFCQLNKIYKLRDPLFEILHDGRRRGCGLAYEIISTLHSYRNENKFVKHLKVCFKRMLKILTQKIQSKAYIIVAERIFDYITPKDYVLLNPD